MIKIAPIIASIMPLLFDLQNRVRYTIKLLYKIIAKSDDP